MGVAMAIEIGANLSTRGIGTDRQADIGLRVDVQALVADGVAVTDGVGMTLGAGDVIQAADMFRVLAR